TRRAHMRDLHFTRRRLLEGAAAVACPRVLFAQTSVEPSALVLARILDKIALATLPSLAISHAKMLVARTLASAAAGIEIGSVRIVRELAKDQGGKREATVWFDGAKLPVTEAARVNAMLSDSAASDDSDLRNVAHTGTCLTAVGLAVAERMGSTG